MSEEKLIEAVREHRELYDTKHANYMNVKLKNRVWCEIAKKLNFKDGKEAKNMWLKLRGSFRDARRRQLKCVNSGADPVHVKPWRFQKQMSFLELLCEGNTADNSNDDSQLLSEPPTSENFESGGVECAREKEWFSQQSLGRNIPQVEERNDVEQPHFTDSGDSYRGSSRHTKFSLTPTTTSTPGMHKKKKNNNNLCGVLKRSMQQRQERARQRVEDRRILLEQNSTLDDPLYNFFISMYQLTKNMPSNYQHRVRAQVFQAVSEAEAAIMNITSDQSPSTFSSSHGSASCSIASLSSYPSPHTSSHSQFLPLMYLSHEMKEETES